MGRDPAGADGGRPGGPPDGPGTDSTLRLPGGSSGPSGRYASDFYDENPADPAELGFGGQYPADEPAPQYQPGAVPSFPTDDGADRTVVLGGGDVGGTGAAGWPAPVPPQRPVADRLLVHLIWELLLLIGVAGLAVWCHWQAPAMFTDGRSLLELQVATLGLLAVGVSLSLRAGAPNLAVGGFAALAGLLFVHWYGHGVLLAAGMAAGVALLGGLVVGLVVAVFQVPGWAASLVALCGILLVVGRLSADGALSLSGASVPDVRSAALPLAIGVVLGSVVFGLLGLIGPIRRAVGAFRPEGDPARRRGVGAAVMVAVALLVSAGLAAGSGVLNTLLARSATGAGAVPELLLALGAVLLGGVSAHGRRGGVLGTVLGVLAISMVSVAGTYLGWTSEVRTYGVAGVAILLGLIVTRLVEWGGRRREPVDAAAAR